VKKKVITAEEGLRYAMSLPVLTKSFAPKVNVQSTGMPRLPSQVVALTRVMPDPSLERTSTGMALGLRGAQA